jgi:hypothetical protein
LRCRSPHGLKAFPSVGAVVGTAVVGTAVGGVIGGVEGVLGVDQPLLRE